MKGPCGAARRRKSPTKGLCGAACCRPCPHRGQIGAGARKKVEGDASSQRERRKRGGAAPPHLGRNTEGTDRRHPQGCSALPRSLSCVVAQRDGPYEQSQ